MGYRLMRKAGAIMANLELAYVKQYRDRTGTMRRYFRRAGKNYGVLPGDIGSPEFMEAYQGYLGAKIPTGTLRAEPGTFGAIVLSFLSSVEFKNLKPSSQRTYRLILNPLTDKHGHKRLSLLTRDAAKNMIAGIGDERPAMANLTRRILSRVFRVAVAAGQWAGNNPFALMTTYKIGSHHTWTEAEMAQYERRWPLGTRERLAYCLLLFSAQRGGDVVKMRRRDVIDGEIHLVQQKTDMPLRIPVHPELAKALKAGPAHASFLIADEHGHQMRGLTVLIRDAAKAAGLPADCKAHGLRKAALTRIAEGGASAKLIMAVSGHKTLREVERYTAAAEQPKLARKAMAMMRPPRPRT
jgi:integrase